MNAIEDVQEERETRDSPSRGAVVVQLGDEAVRGPSITRG